MLTYCVWGGEAEMINSASVALQSKLQPCRLLGWVEAVESHRFTYIEFVVEAGRGYDTTANPVLGAAPETFLSKRLKGLTLEYQQ